ncbi:uncharacterized protein LOC113354812 [Papaver somniferum]|uniref:uncharacterized protein LOC113354812 n=1 Tax=Papaver somniferum TaxID=3469 RepID=UPI000E6FB649|nr:uncharacterized protein LOC113354812 [Papaver somniferum]
MFCCDGSSFGNTSAAGFGVVVRDHDCQVLGTLTGGIGIAFNYTAEVYAIICAMELAIEWCKEKILIVSDSQIVMNEFIHGQIPWFIRSIWKQAVGKFSQIKYNHCYREVNFSADSVAKKGANLAPGERQLYTGRPSSLRRVEMSNVKYHRFC